MFIVITILLNVVAVAIWSVITGQNGFAEVLKLLRGEPSFIRTGPKFVTGSGEAFDPEEWHKRMDQLDETTPQTSPGSGGGGKKRI